MIKILMLSAVLITGCQADAGHLRQAAASPDIAADGAPAERQAAPRDSEFEPADGVAVFVADAAALEKAKFVINVYASDGGVMKQIDYRDDSLDSLEGEEGRFFPLDFSNGASREFALEMRVTGRSKNWLRVVAHETSDPPAVGFIRASDPLFKMLAWDEWVLDHFNIRFDKDSNPVLQSPDGPAKYAGFPEEPLIRPDEVKGDWVRIRWTAHEPDEPSPAQIAKDHPENVGWIRWRNGREILIGEFYP